MAAPAGFTLWCSKLCLPLLFRNRAQTPDTFHVQSGTKVLFAYFCSQNNPRHCPRYRAQTPDMFHVRSDTKVLFAYFFFQEKVGYFPTTLWHSLTARSTALRMFW